MTNEVRFTKEAKADLHRLLGALGIRDPALARKARLKASKGIDLLKEFPFSCPKVAKDNPFWRELVVPFGTLGYVALFEIEDSGLVTVLAIRHQRQDDYY